MKAPTPYQLSRAEALLRHVPVNESLILHDGMITYLKGCGFTRYEITKLPNVLANAGKVRLADNDGAVEVWKINPVPPNA